MLLNASHEITNCGLPQHVQDRYIRYKQGITQFPADDKGNRAIVAWLTKYGPEKYKGRKTLPIKQLIALGYFLCDKVQEIGTLPSDVDFYFKEVIKERSYLSQHFRHHRDKCENDAVDTVNHEHFTESLKQIHQILLTAGKPGQRYKVRKLPSGHSDRSPSSTSSINEGRNIFKRLSFDDDFDDHRNTSEFEEALSDTDTNATSECSHTAVEDDDCFPLYDEPVVDLLDADGDVDLAIQGLMVVKFINTITQAVIKCWGKAGRQELSVLAAAANTNVLMLRMLTQIRMFTDDQDTPLTATMIMRSIEALSCHDHANLLLTQEDDLETLENLSLVENCLTCRQGCNSTAAFVSNHSSVASTSTKEILVGGLLVSMQDSLVVSAPSLVLDGLSCIEILSSSKLHDSLLASTACLYVLAECHGAFSQALSNQGHMALPRISALKFANEASSTINLFIDNKSIFPCQCVNTLGYRVAQMKIELDSFARYKCWNSLMQNPTIAGNHSLEILDLCSYYGLQLLHYRQWAAAVLYSYQALVHLGYTSRIVALEAVCDLLAPVLYPTGARPTSGFMASWLRYIGARLKFRKGKQYQDHKDTWCMAVPAHVAARSAGLNIRGNKDDAAILPKFDYGTIDLTVKCKHDGWILLGDAASEFDRAFELCSGKGIRTEQSDSSSQLSVVPSLRIHTTKHKRTKSCQTKHTATSHETKCFEPQHVFDASFTIDASQRRSVPTGKLNLLSLFNSMTQVVSGISDATHADQRDKRGRGQMCLCFVQTILRAADRIQDVRKKSGVDAKGAVMTKNEKECVKCYKDQLMSMLANDEVLEGGGGKWLWNSI